MGKLRASSAVAMLALAACGSDHAQPDASIKIIDAPPPDMKVFMDAPPGPNYDFSCFGGSAPTTAADPITISGSTQSFSMGGAQPVPMADVDFYKTGTASPLATVMSDANGAFMTGDIATGGTPLDGYVRAMEPGYRSTYLYPPNLVTASLSNVPVVMITPQTFGMIEIVAGAQDDTVNGAVLVLVTDCANTPIDGATVKVQQGSADVGNVIDLGQFISQAAGTFFALNVPDGSTELLVSYDNMNFPTRTVVAHKKPMGTGAEGTLTVTQVRPGP